MCKSQTDTLDIDRDKIDKAALELGDQFAPLFDEKGLMPVITQDSATGDILMFAYMNKEAIAKTLELGEAVYYSRSRQALWHKGHISGEVQKVDQILTDCDQDILLLKVTMIGRGAACHTGRVSCFYREIVASDDGVKLEMLNMPVRFDPKDIY